MLESLKKMMGKVFDGPALDPETQKLATSSDKIIDRMAADMPEQKAVWWAGKSSEMVEGQMTPEDIQAKKAAEMWVKNPSPENKSAAETAAKQTDYKGPGAWAAQAAAWSKEPSGAGGAEMAQNVPEESTATPELTPQPHLAATAAAGSVKLAAAMKNSPDTVRKILAESAQAEVFAKENPPDFQADHEIDLPGVNSNDTMKKDKAGLQENIPRPTKAEMKKTAQSIKPFIDLGKDIAEGKNTWL